MSDDEAPAGLTIGTRAAPLDTAALTVLGRLVTADDMGAVLTGDDQRDELWPLPPRLPMMNQGMQRSMLAVDVVRFVGEAVAIVVAETAAQAADGLPAGPAEVSSPPAGSPARRAPDWTPAPRPQEPNA